MNCCYIQSFIELLLNCFVIMISLIYGMILCGSFNSGYISLSGHSLFSIQTGSSFVTWCFSFCVTHSFIFLNSFVF